MTLVRAYVIVLLLPDNRRHTAQAKAEELISLLSCFANELSLENLLCWLRNRAKGDNSAPAIVAVSSRRFAPANSSLGGVSCWIQPVSDFLRYLESGDGYIKRHGRRADMGSTSRVCR